MNARTLTILQMNDTHGYLEPHPEIVWGAEGPSFPTMGGYARIAAVFNRARSENPGGVLALDNGDTLHGTHPAVSSKGEALVPLLNALGLDAMTAHWEFAWGPRHFFSLARRLSYPVLALNCYALDGGGRPLPGSILLERAGMRIGVIGLAATIIDKSMPPHFSEGHRFTSGREELPGEIALLKEQGADLIVLLSHLGFPQDVAIAKSIGGIDVILSGHTHNRLERPVIVGKTLIIQSGCHGSFLGRLDLTVGEEGISGWHHELISVDDKIEPDPQMERLVARTMEPLRPILSRTIGETKMALHRDTTLDAPMDDVLLAAIAEAAGTDIAFSNGWRYGAPVPPGIVTLGDLWNMIPTNPPVSTVDVTGREIWEMLEENLERTFSHDPFGQMGGYLKRFRGLRVHGKIENPKDLRLVAIFTAEGPLELDRTYTVAFVTAQGVPGKFGKNRVDLPVHAIEALTGYVQRGVGDSIEGAGRFTAV